MRILLIVPPERFDFYSYLEKAQNAEWMLLWYEKKQQMKVDTPSLPLPFSSISFWADFTTPKQLIKKLRPDRIVFFEIIDLRQIALIVASSAAKIPSFYLEHGAAGDKDTAIERWKEIEFRQHKLPYLVNRFRNSFADIFRSKIFYYSVVKGFYSFSSYLRYLLLPFKMLRSAPNKVLSLNTFRERVPTKSIVFNEANFNEYALYTGIEHSDALLTGVPYFDRYFKNDKDSKEYIVYIDHPYFEENLAGWTEEHHNHIAQSLFRFAEERKIKIFIKLHPRSNLSLWEKYKSDNNFVEIIQFGDYTDLYLESKIILAFSSSLVNGFICARKNVVLLGWHPEPFIFGADFSATGLCHVSYKAEDLFTEFDSWATHNLTMENAEAYDQYLKRFNYPFDGKATERVIKAITSDEVS